MPSQSSSSRHHGKDKRDKHHSSKHTSSSSSATKSTASASKASGSSNTSTPDHTHFAIMHSNAFKKHMQHFADVMKDLDDWYNSLNASALASLKVTCVPLDLDNSTSKHSRPIPLQKMKAWIDEKKPWYDDIECGKGPNDMWTDPWLNATGLGTGLWSFVSMSKDAYNRTGSPLDHSGIIDKTQWVSSMLDPDIRGRNDSAYFDITMVLDPKDDSPHLTAFLAMRNDLEEGRLRTIELCCLYELTKFRHEEISSLGHNIPITLISASGFQCRVLVAYLDIMTGFLNVQMSPLLRFDYDGYRLSDDFARLMCWMLADPIGDTRF